MDRLGALRKHDSAERHKEVVSGEFQKNRMVQRCHLLLAGLEQSTTLQPQELLLQWSK